MCAQRLALAVLFVLCVATSARPSDAQLPAELVQSTARRRVALRKTLGKTSSGDFAIVFAQPMTDILQPRQEGDYLYLTGVREPGGILLMGPETETLFLLDYGPRGAQFYGLRYQASEETSRALGLPTKPLPRRTARAHALLLKQIPEGATLRIPSYRGGDHAPVRERRQRLIDYLKKARPNLKIGDLSEVLHAQRAIKDPWEIAQMRKAIAISVRGFQSIVPYVRKGRMETDVESAFYSTIRAMGARAAYPIIAGSGRNAAIPHYFANDAPLAPNSLLVVDAGAAIHRYAADITRTFPVSGKFSTEQARIYNAVLESQLAGIAVVRPGVSFRDIQKASADVLKKHGLAQYFIHGVSHFVGLDVHDPGPRKLLPGMVLTVEPGVYLLEESIGVRIEDMVVVTENGCEVLTDGLPKTVDEVEKWMAR